MEHSQGDGSVARYALGLTEVEVRRFQDIMRRECGVELTPEDSWARAIELMALFRVLVGSATPGARDRSSNIEAIDADRNRGKD